MRSLWPLHRSGPKPRAQRYGYEAAGLTIHDQPIPWNAEAALVDTVVEIPLGCGKTRTDFYLRLPGRDPVPPETMSRAELQDCYRLGFRVPPPVGSVTAEIGYRTHTLGQLTLPHLTRAEFLQQLQIEMPTLFVGMGDHTVACETYVASQCRGLQLTALLSSPTCLAPLLDLGLAVELTHTDGKSIQSIPVKLGSSQLCRRQTLVTVTPRVTRRRAGHWSAAWVIGDSTFASQQFRSISQTQFRSSLRLADTRFLSQDLHDVVHVARHAPALDGVSRLGPCFLITSQEPGMAGLCALQVRMEVPGAVKPPILTEEEVLVTDGPTVFAPGTVDVDDLAKVLAFELRTKNGSLGLLSLRPAPMAAFTAEGGFKPATDFTWTAGADEELSERLGKLFEKTRG